MPRTRRGYEYPDGTYPVRTHGDIEALATSVDADVARVAGDTAAAQSSADNARNIAERALERYLVKAYVNEAIVTTSGARGSLALTNTVLRYPDSTRDATQPRRLYSPISCIAAVSAGVEWAAVGSGSGGSTGPRLAQIRANAGGVPTAGSAPRPATRIDPNGATYAPYLSIPEELIRLDAGGYVELFVEHGQGSGVAVTTATYLQLRCVRPL